MGNSNSYPSGNSFTAHNADRKTSPSSWWRDLCSLESTVMSHANGLMEDFSLRLQPRLGYGFRAQLAQEAVDLVDNSFRLGGFQTEFQHAAGRELCAARLGHESPQPLRLNGSLLRKLDGDRVPSAVDGEYANPLRQQLERRRSQQVADWWRGLAIAIGQLFAHVVERRLALNAGRALVHAQALVFFGNIVGRNAQVDSQVELGADFV